MREQPPNFPALAACKADIVMAASVPPAHCDGEEARFYNNPERKRERPQAKKDELTAGAEILKATFDNLRQGFLVLDEQWRITSFNDRICELFGYPPHVVRLGATIYDLVCAMAALGLYPGRSAAQAYEPWRQRLERRAPGSHITRVANGRTLEISYATFAKGGWIITYEDISARVNAEAALAEQNERFEAALTNIPHGVCMFDADKRLILCNVGYIKLYALPPDLTLAGTSCQRIFDHLAASGGAPVETANYLDFAEEAETAQCARSARFKLQDGRVVRIAHNPIGSGGFVATHEDVTQASGFFVLLSKKRIGPSLW
jgi:PAS domain-containing protein